MSNFSINQVRHLYVANTPKTTLNASVSSAGDTAICGVAGEMFYVAHVNKGGELVLSDKIKADKVISVVKTANASLKSKLAVKTVTVTNVQAGEVYTIKVTALGAFGGGTNETVTKIASYRAKTGDNAAAVAAALKLELEANADGLYSATVASAVITISEVEQPWKVGRMPVHNVGIVISLGATPSYGVSWATIAAGAAGTANDADKKLQDLEWFCIGARTSRFEFDGLLPKPDLEFDTTKTYDVIDIHYYDVTSNEGVQKSERDLTLLVPTASSATILALIESTITPPAADDNNG